MMTKLTPFDARCHGAAESSLVGLEDLAPWFAPNRRPQECWCPGVRQDRQDTPRGQGPAPDGKAPGAAAAAASQGQDAAKEQNAKWDKKRLCCHSCAWI